MKNGNKRTTGKDQYYTLPDVVDICISIAMKYYKTEQKILEPAGGTGEFIEGLLRYGIDQDYITSYDIEPKHRMVKHQDFLKTQIQTSHFTISNPPFGRVNSLSVKFFNTASSFSTHICFLIPISWRKWSIINRLDNRFHLVEDVEMPEVSFYNDNGPILGGNLRTVFQVWEKRNYIRPKIVIEDRGYIQKTTPEDADIAFTFFGHSSGRVERIFERKHNSTKSFFKVQSFEVIQALENIDFSVFNENTAYIKSLSMPEINSLLNNYFDSKHLEGD